MRNLIPFEFAELGVAEFAWFFLVIGGLSLLGTRGGRVRVAVWSGILLALGGLLRFIALEEEGTAWTKWAGPVLFLPGLVAGGILLGRARWRQYGAAAWLGTLVLLSAIANPFDLKPIEWLFLAAIGFGLASIAQGPGPLRDVMGRRFGPVRGWVLLAAGFFCICLLGHPFGLTHIAGIGFLFGGWLVYAVLAQGTEMRKYVARRLIGAPVVLLILITLSFFLIRQAPGGPFDKDKRLEPEIKALVEAEYGLDEPLLIQFRDYMKRLLWEGDLGPSFKYKDSTVNEVIARHAPESARLGLAAVCLAVLVGVTAGLISGIKQNSIFDYTSMAFAMLGLALPTFIVGPMLVLVFAMNLDWFSVTGWQNFPRDLVLPAITLALPFMARIARLTRAGMLEIVNQDYIRTARAKGLSEPKIVVRHTLKGTLLPVVSFLGPGIAQLLTGSLVVEKIFGVPGMGNEFVNSALNRDYGVALGLVLVFGTLLVVFNLIVDIIYAFLDPRIRHG